MTEQVERLIERLNFGNACQAPEANGSRCGQCQCCQRAQGATMIERLSAEKAALIDDFAIERSTGQEQVETLSSQLAELKAAKWDVKHTDTMNDLVQMGMARDDAIAKLAEARGALEKAGSQFRFYEREHRAKAALPALPSAPEALRKAEVNRAMADMCEAALRTGEQK